MSLSFDSIYSKFGDGGTDAKSKLREIYENPGNYTQEQIKSAFYGALDRPSYDNEDYLRDIGSDDEDWVRDEAKFGTDTNAYESALNRLLLSARSSSSSSSSPSSSSSSSSPKPKLPVLTGGRSTATPGSDADSARYMGMTPAEYEDFIDQREYEQLLGLGNQDARSRALIQELRNQSAAEVASITAAATMYGDDRRFDAADVTSRRDKEARMYVADVQGLATTNKAKIDGAFSVKLQNIITRGAEDVEKIRGKYGLAGQRIAGEYGLERDRIQGATARDVANRNRDAQIFGTLMSGFWS